MKSLYESLLDTNIDKDIASSIDEALSDPVLIRLWDQIRNTKGKSGEKPTLKKILNLDVAIDKITPSYRHTYKPTDKNVLKEAVKCINGAACGKFVIFESGGRFTSLYEGQTHYCNKWIFEEDRISRRIITGRSTVSQSMQFSVENAELVHIYDVYSDKDLDVWKLQKGRIEAKQGAVAMMSEDELRQMLRDQQKRYQLAVAKIKAERNTAEYKEIVKKVEGIMTRFTKFVNKLITDQRWAQDIESRSRTDYVFQGQQAVIRDFQTWSRALIKVRAGDSFKFYSESLERYKDALELSIKQADDFLSKVGL